DSRRRARHRSADIGSSHNGLLATTSPRCDRLRGSARRAPSAGRGGVSGGPPPLANHVPRFQARRLWRVRTDQRPVAYPASITRGGYYRGCLSTNVVSGTAWAVVVATGDRPYFGSLALGVLGRRVPTSFDKGVNGVSRLLIRFMSVI